MYITGKFCSQIETLREVWCVNMFFHKWQMLIRSMLETDADLSEESTGKENERPDKEE